VDIALEHPRFEKAFVDELEKLLGVQECHFLAGDFAYRLKVKAADPAALAEFLQKRILAIKGVTRMQAQISLSSKKESTLLPLMPERRNERNARRTEALVRAPSYDVRAHHTLGPLSEPERRSHVRGDELPVRVRGDVVVRQAQIDAEVSRRP
jgi:hypothetical protein